MSTRTNFLYFLWSFVWHRWSQNFPLWEEHYYEKLTSATGMGFMKSWQKLKKEERMINLTKKLVDVDCGRRLWTVPFTELMSDSAEGSTFWRCYIQKVLPFYKDHFWFILFLTMLVLAKTNNIRKQRSKGALRKNCSDNMQQICRRTPIPKCDFNKVALQPYWNRTSVWLFSCKVAVCFQNTFSEEHLWTAASEYILC